VQGNGGEKVSSGEGSDEGGEGLKLSREIPCKVTEVRRDLMLWLMNEEGRKWDFFT
jgi:hypothetical protein